MWKPRISCTWRPCNLYPFVVKIRFIVYHSSHGEQEADHLHKVYKLQGHSQGGPRGKGGRAPSLWGKMSRKSAPSHCNMPIIIMQFSQKRVHFFALCPLGKTYKFSGPEPPPQRKSGYGPELDRNKIQVIFPNLKALEVSVMCNMICVYPMSWAYFAINCSGYEYK